MSEPKKGWGEKILDDLAGCFGSLIDWGLFMFIVFQLSQMTGDTAHLGAMIFGMYARWRWKVHIGKK